MVVERDGQRTVSNLSADEVNLIEQIRRFRENAKVHASHKRHKSNSNSNNISNDDTEGSAQFQASSSFTALQASRAQILMQTQNLLEPQDSPSDAADAAAKDDDDNDDWKSKKAMASNPSVPPDSNGDKPNNLTKTLEVLLEQQTAVTSMPRAGLLQPASTGLRRRAVPNEATENDRKPRRGTGQEQPGAYAMTGIDGSDSDIENGSTGPMDDSGLFDEETGAGVRTESGAHISVGPNGSGSSLGFNTDTTVRSSSSYTAVTMQRNALMQQQSSVMCDSDEDAATQPTRRGSAVSSMGFSRADKRLSIGSTPIAASIVEKPTEADVLSPEEMEELAKPGVRRRQYIFLATLICGIIAIVIGVTVSITTRGKEITTLAPTSTPTTSPTLTLESRVEYLQEVVVRNTIPSANSTSLFLPNTPQHKAFEWLAQEEPMQEEELRILQRYVLALLYFSTDGTNWGRYHVFLDPGHECTWMITGITCSEDGVITELDFCECPTRGYVVLTVSLLLFLSACLFLCVF